MSTVITKKSISEIISEKDVLTKSVYREIKKLFEAHRYVYIKDYVDIKDAKGKIMFVGPRFATVKMENGYEVAINYGGILDNQSQKGSAVSLIEFM
ncbi:hypothetical protein [Bacillus cereus]|uniref:hypothetical protein n=1 Tax=Bacillus cereus TaxID=1396 RepID=UPI000B4C1E79|nr:hypothetical protein [Bacillus cereus]